jgi:uncharacterized membrane protein YozB (DUF420 family)
MAPTCFPIVSDATTLPPPSGSTSHLGSIGLPTLGELGAVMTMSVAIGRAVNPERRFYQWMVIAVTAAVALGFVRSFLLRPLFPHVHAPKEIFFYVHGVVFALWFALLVTQASLVSAGNVALHRRLGIVACGLVPLMIVFGAIGGAIAAHRPGGFVDIPVPPLEFLIVPYIGLLLFGLFIGAALVLRGNPQTHKRLMLIGTFVIAEAGIARWPFEPYISVPPFAMFTAAAFVIPIALWDLYSRRSIHPVTVIGAVVLFAEGPLRDLISHTAPWLAFAKWASDLAA